MFIHNRKHLIPVLACALGLCLPAVSNAKPEATQSMSIDDICALLVKAKINSDTRKVCQLASQAYQIGGNQACKGYAVEYMQIYNCSTKKQNSSKQSNSSSNKSATAKKRSNIALDADEICKLLIISKMNRNHDRICELSKEAINLAGTSACRGTAQNLFNGYCPGGHASDAFPAKAHKPAANSSNTLSPTLDELCALAVKSRIMKDNERVCEYYAAAINLGGKNACQGQAHEIYSKLDCTSSLDNTESKLCSIVQKAKHKTEACNSAEKAFALFGKDACEGQALDYIKNNGCQTQIDVESYSQQNENTAINLSGSDANNKKGQSNPFSDYCILILKAENQNDADSVCYLASTAIELGGSKVCPFDVKSYIHKYCKN